MDQETLQECLVEQLRDIYDAENQLVKALPKLAKACENEELAEALTEHLKETQGQVKRLEEAFAALGVPAKSKPGKGMRGLIEEGSEAAEEEDAVIRDLAIIAGAQRVEHYEIAAYGTARTMAEQLGNKKVAQLLEDTEDEEQSADSKLSEIAMSIYEQEDSSAEDEKEEEETHSVKAAAANNTARKQPSAQDSRAKTRAAK